MRMHRLFALCLLVQGACISARAQSHASVLGKFFALDKLPDELPVDSDLLRLSADSVAKFDDASGVVIEGGFFITARHVAKDAKRRGLNKIRVQSGGGWQELTLAETPLTIQSLPYDFAVYRINAENFMGTPARIRTTPLERGEAVFGVGFVWNPDQKDTPDRKEVTVGSVADANTAGRSFCEYTNEDDVAVVENWRLEAAGCIGVDYSKIKYHAREERDPLLTKSPMTFGMSGSPLFDKDGLLVGIGSNVLSSTPLDYDPAKFAVYVKAANVAKALKNL